jgi:hypothetical protein
MKNILNDIELETIKQFQKWGIQDHPSLIQNLLNREGGCTPERMCEEYEIPSENRARQLCEIAASKMSVTWAHIAIEELSEAISAESDRERRDELVQLGAVIASWIECIDKKLDLYENTKES